MFLILYYRTQWTELGFIQGRLGTHGLNSFERGLRRGWTDSFSQGGKEGKSACYGRPAVRQ